MKVELKTKFWEKSKEELIKSIDLILYLPIILSSINILHQLFGTIYLITLLTNTALLIGSILIQQSIKKYESKQNTTNEE